MSRLISRDPFAREELHSRRVQVHGSSSLACRFCGNVAQTFRGARFLLVYYMESDSGRRKDIEGAFCSVGCMRSYHG